MRIAAGTLKPALEATLSDRTGTLSLSGAVVRVVAEQAGATLFTDTSPTVNMTTNLVTHTWATGQTDHKGRGFYHVDVDLGDGRWIRFPQLGDLPFDVE